MPCLCAATRLAARAITRVYEAEFRAVGLQAPQFWLLMELSQKERTSQVELLKHLAIDQTTLSRNLAVLVKHEWAKSEAHGRERHYSVTTAGNTILNRAKPQWVKAQKKMQQALGPDWETVLAALDRLTTAAQGDL